MKVYLVRADMPRRGVVHKSFFKKSGTEIAKYPPIGTYKTIRKMQLLRIVMGKKARK